VCIVPHSEPEDQNTVSVDHSYAENGNIQHGGYEIFFSMAVPIGEVIFRQNQDYSYKKICNAEIYRQEFHLKNQPGTPV
jgi:hypothetical protein